MNFDLYQTFKQYGYSKNGKKRSSQLKMLWKIKTLKKVSLLYWYNCLPLYVFKSSNFSLSVRVSAMTHEPLDWFASNLVRTTEMFLAWFKYLFKSAGYQAISLEYVKSILENQQNQHKIVDISNL